MLVEVCIKGVSTFMLADEPTKDAEDVRALYLEKKYNPKDHMDLWRQLPDVRPDLKRKGSPQGPLPAASQPEPASSIEEFDMNKVSKVVNVQELMAGPKWDWAQIFSL